MTTNKHEVAPTRKAANDGAGATEEEVASTVDSGERFLAKFGRKRFRRNFVFDGEWRGRRYSTKQVEAYAVDAGGECLVVTVLVKYF